MKSSVKDQVEGTFHQIKGKVKEFAGKISGKPNLEAEGKAEEVAGEVQEKVGDVKRFSGSRDGIKTKKACESMLMQSEQTRLPL